MKRKIEIRKMIPADMDSVTQIYGEIYHPAYISYSELGEGKAIAPGLPSENAVEIFRQQIVCLLEACQEGLFVASCESKVVGFALASLRKTSAGYTECWLDDLGVLPNYRHQQIGEKLVEQILTWSAQQGAKHILLESGIHNEGAHKLFERLGFHSLSIVFWKGIAISNQ